MRRSTAGRPMDCVSPPIAPLRHRRQLQRWPATHQIGDERSKPCSAQCSQATEKPNGRTEKVVKGYVRFRASYLVINVLALLAWVHVRVLRAAAYI